MKGFIITRVNTGQTAQEILDVRKKQILGQLKTNISANKRNELLREFNTLNQ